MFLVCGVWFLFLVLLPAFERGRGSAMRSGRVCRYGHVVPLLFLLGEWGVVMPVEGCVGFGPGLWGVFGDVGDASLRDVSVVSGLLEMCVFGFLSRRLGCRCSFGWIEETGFTQLFGP